MGKQDNLNFKLLKIFIIPCILCTAWFILDPSLNLSKIIDTYQYEIDEFQRYVRHLTYCFSGLAYILSQLTIFLACYMALRFRADKLVYWLIGNIILFLLLPQFTSFPTIGQLSLVWSVNRNALSIDIIHYSLLFPWLIAWIATLSISIVVLSLCQHKTALHF